MFAGIIDALGIVEIKKKARLGVRAKIRKPKLGASVAINGACLTLVETNRGLHQFDVGPETWARTNLGLLRNGDLVNVEPSLRLADEVGGHFLSGHVDATAKILGLESWTGDFKRLRVELPKALRGLVAAKGSIAIDGISLTVASVSRAFFDVMVIPHTLSRTTLGRRHLGDRVNLEADLMARYAASVLEAMRGG